MKALKKPIFGELQNNKTIQWKGKEVSPADDTYIVKGKKISIINDTSLTKTCNELAEDADLLKQLCLNEMSLTPEAFIVWRRMDFFIVDSHTTVSALMEFLAECEESGNNLFGRCMACKGPPVEGTLLRCGNCSKTLGACCAGAEKYSEDTHTLQCPICEQITCVLPTV
jgi:hypothetical protein